METKKIIKISLITLGVLGGGFGLYKGVTWAMANFGEGETGGKDEVITLKDGTTITISADSKKRATSEDVMNLREAMNKWKAAGKLPQIVYDEIVKGASKFNRSGIQRMMTYFEKADLSDKYYGFVKADYDKFILLINTAKVYAKQ